jgi:hypothetical protein
MTAFFALKFLFQVLIRKQEIWFVKCSWVPPNNSNDIANLLLLFFFRYLTVFLIHLLHLITLQVNFYLVFGNPLIGPLPNSITHLLHLITLQVNLNLTFGNPLIGPLPNSITL